MKRITLLSAIICCSYINVNAQCSAGEVQVYIDADTDNWGSEVYWELLPNGNNCGTAALFTGGNSAVGCNGGGVQANPGGGYSNNVVVTEGPWCLASGTDYDIAFVDDYGDGGLTFTVRMAGYDVYTIVGKGAGSSHTFRAFDPPPVDAAVTTIGLDPYVESGDNVVHGDLRNEGTTNITSVEINYSIDNGTAVMQTLTGLNIQPFATYEYTFATAWTESASASYSVKVWVSNVNGAGADDDPTYDDMTESVVIVGPVTNIIPSYLSGTNTFTFEVIGNSTDQIDKPQDLDFHPGGDLWVVNRGIGGNVSSGGGTTVSFSDPGGPSQDSDFRKDQNSKHFMNSPTGIAFSINGNFSTSPGMYDANFSGGSPFTGPALWSSEPDIYAKPSGGNGSHLDMLHASSYAMGVAYEKGNVFWVFDGNNNDIVRYDFASDHGPGNTDHDDGGIRRYTGMSVSKIDEIIGSHMELDGDAKWMYIVDNGNQRVIRLDITSGNVGGTPSYGPYETLAEYKNIDGATWETVVDAGLVEPSGIDVLGNYMVVTDHSTGDIIFYDISSMPAVELSRVATGNPGIMGTVIGPDGYVWYVNYTMDQVVKVVPGTIIASVPSTPTISAFSMYPNPSNGSVMVDISLLNSSGAKLLVQDMLGETVLELRAVVGSVNINLASVSNGTYLISLEDNETRITKRLVIQK